MSFIITNDNITLFHNGQPITTPRANFGDNEWHELITALNDYDYDTAASLIDRASAARDYFKTSDKITIAGGQILYQGHPLDNYPATKALEFMREGLPYQPLLNFIERLMESPSYRVVQRLYEFLEAGGLPLTEDGCFMAYKKVRRNDDRLVDIHSERFTNDPGTKVEVPRNQVDEDQDNTCSYGLHVCSYAYLPSFGSGHWDVVVAVKVDPSDVVAIPRDYDNAKMRVCAYEVVQEVPDYTETDTLRLVSLFGFDTDDDDDDELNDILDEAGVPSDDRRSWQLWEGGSIPVPFATRVDVIHRGRDLYYDALAGSKTYGGYAEDWSIDPECPDNGDIVAWRLAALGKAPGAHPRSNGYTRDDELLTIVSNTDEGDMSHLKGWRLWEGHPMPVAQGTLIDVIHGDNTYWAQVKASDLLAQPYRWDLTTSLDDRIVAWRFAE